MCQQRAVAASHVADAARLLRNGTIEDFDDDLVELLEVRDVRSAAAPDVHGAVDHRFEAARIDARDSRVTEEQRRQDGKHRASTGELERQAGGGGPELPVLRESQGAPGGPTDDQQAGQELT